MKSPLSKHLIKKFVSQYNINIDEFNPSNIKKYKSFNNFFIRKVHSQHRPINNDANLIYPADGRHLLIKIQNTKDNLTIKNFAYSISEFLNSEELAQNMKNGWALISRLAPVDYHRYHFPCDAIAGQSKLINGKLYSVNPIALKSKKNIFLENKRVITNLKTKDFGNINLVEIGATCVGSIKQTYKPGAVKCGQEKGYFEFGGSTIVTLIPKNNLLFDNDLKKYSTKGIEIFSKMGETLASKLK